MLATYVRQQALRMGTLDADGIRELRVKVPSLLGGEAIIRTKSGSKSPMILQRPLPYNFVSRGSAQTDIFAFAPNQRKLYPQTPETATQFSHGGWERHDIAVPYLKAKAYLEELARILKAQVAEQAKIARKA